MELMTQEEFDKRAENMTIGEAKAAYAAALARIATLETQLAAQREQIERLLNEAAHS